MDMTAVPPLTRLRQYVERAIVGQTVLVERLLTALLADGHTLVEGLPGLAKTTAVRTLAAGLALSFQRIQFTPDMIPGDVTGSEIYLPQEGRFQYVPGPLFHQIVLADEINRAPPKVQSAMLEAMQEYQVTVGGVSRAVPEIFMVMATQNPIEQEGTYPLPEAQLDRFLMKVEIDFPSAEEELEILRRETARLREGGNVAIEAVMSAADLAEARLAARGVYMDAMLERYIVAIVGATRQAQHWDAELAQWLARGASPRATLALAKCARARAHLHGRDFVEPSDIIDLAPAVLNHRIGLSYAARAEGVTPARAIARVLEKVPVP